MQATGKACERLAALFLLQCICFSPPSNAEENEQTLAGEWRGRWTDSRPEYGGSGGDFSGVAIEKSLGVYACVFTIGKGREFKVELKSRNEDGKLIFNGAVDLGKVQGVYILKGRMIGNEFSGEYDGPDEKGTFKMTRKVFRDSEKAK